MLVIMDVPEIAAKDNDQPEEARSANLFQAMVGVLLVHGLNGSLHDMDDFAEQLASTGIITENILLPGHGTRVDDMFPMGWSEWSAAVKQALQALKQRCTVVFLIGHSLGGALCLHVAAHEEVDGIITLCAPVRMQPWLLSVVRLVKRVTPIVPTVRKDVCDPQARRYYTREVYRWTPMAPVESMLQYLPRLREELPRVTAPALIIHSLHDHVVPACDGQMIYHLIGSKEKQILIFHRSYHVIMKDHDRAEVFAKTLAFIQRNTPGTK